MPPRKKSSAKAQGIFHGLSEVLREAIVTVAMKDAPFTRKKNNDAIQLQATAQRIVIGHGILAGKYLAEYRDLLK